MKFSKAKYYAEAQLLKELNQTVHQSPTTLTLPSWHYSASINYRQISYVKDECDGGLGAQELGDQLEFYMHIQLKKPFPFPMGKTEGFNKCTNSLVTYSGGRHKVEKPL